MVSKILLLCLFVVIFSERLIILDKPNQPIYMSEKEIESKQNSVGFEYMDITDYPNLHLGNVPKSSNDPLPEKPRKQEIVKRIVARASQKNLEEMMEKYTSIHTRYYKSATGIEAPLKLKKDFENVISSLPEARKSLFSTQTFTHTRYEQTSTICTMKGRSDEIVIIGAHIDSISRPVESRSPGADDDMSGITVMFESFRLLAQSDFIPDRTIQFMAYSAEEVGLLGSQDIAQKYKNDKVAVFSVLQLDMTGFVYRNQTKIGVAHDQWVSRPLANFTTQLIDTYTNVGWTVSSCSHACSDHASFTVRMIIY